MKNGKTVMMDKLTDKISIKNLMAVFCIISLLLILVILFGGYWQQRNIIMRQNNENFAGMIRQMIWTTSEKCRIYNNIVDEVAYNSEIQSYLEMFYEDEQGMKSKSIREYLFDFRAMDDAIYDIAVLSNHGHCINLNGDVEMYYDICKEIPENVLYYYTGAIELKYDYNNMLPRTCIIVGVPVYSLKTFDQSHKIGIVLMAIDAKRLMGIDDEANGSDGELLLFDRNNQLFYDSNEESGEKQYFDFFDEQGNAQNEVIINGQNYHIQSGETDYLEGQIIFMISDKSLFRDVEQMRNRQIIFLFMVMTLEIILVCFLVRNIIRPISELVVFLNRIEQGDIGVLKQRLSISGPQEIVSLVEHFNRMLGEVNDLTHRLVQTSMNLYEAELSRQQAELEYLYAQMNPHFLFNTLESIKGCAVTEEAWKCFRMLDALGALFRYSVRQDANVKLQEELELIKDYLSIQQMRFGDKLDYSIDVPEDMLECVIPKMILQPLVENAIIHGVEKLSRKGIIELKGMRKDEKMLLQICNDGFWLDEEHIAFIRDKITTKPAKERHIGMYNVNKRLQLLYGKESGLYIQGRENGGLTVTLVICMSEGK